MSGMLLSLIGLAAAAGGAAGSASEAGQLTTWSTSAVEAVPFLGGSVAIRAAEHLGLRADLDQGGVFSTEVTFRLPPDKSLPARVDLYQLSVDRRTSLGTLRLGRQTRLDPRGWLPLDGVSLDVPGSDFFKPTVFVGRAWTPEVVQDSLSTWLGGVNLTMRPPDGEGDASRSVAFNAGWMGRLSDGALSHSLVAGASYRTPRGANASADAEIRLGGDAPGSRAGLRATAILGRHVALTPELRWEDLSPDGEVSGSRTPMDWLGGEGYAVAALATRVTVGSVDLVASGGPVSHMDETGLGGLGRGSVGWSAGDLRVAAFGSGAAVSGSWLAGGGLEGDLHADRLSARAEAGLFRFQPLDGRDATIGEARARIGTPLVASSDASSLMLSLDGAVGADRQLAPWARAALVLEGRLGPGESP